MKLITQLCCILALFSAAHAQVTLTGFGSGQFANSGTAGGTFSNTSDTASFDGIDTNNINTHRFAGIFAAQNITGATASLSLTATVTTNPSTSFTVLLLDNVNDAVATYSGNWASFGTGSPATVILPLSSLLAGNQNTVSAVVVSFGGAGSALNVTFDNLSAIPEPSTYALLVGVFALAMVVYRRR